VIGSLTRTGRVGMPKLTNKQRLPGNVKLWESVFIVLPTLINITYLASNLVREVRRGVRPGEVGFGGLFI